jgi:hypothetical protein
MKKLTGYSLALAFLMMAFSSFTPGGDTYEILLGKERIADQIVYSKKPVPEISLKPQHVNDQLSVYYNHCGKVGNNRSITIRTKDSKTEKSWKFPDASFAASMVKSKSYMKVNAGEILQLMKKSGKDQLQLYYYSKEIPEGRLLAIVE